MRAEDKTHISVYIDRELIKRLKVVAKQELRSVSAVCVMAAREYLAKNYPPLSSKN